MSEIRFTSATEFSENLDPKEFILIKGARVNNLKNISVAIPRNKLVVITGLSGSGKSSLAFNTLFAEGQRMYVESLSSYARQFLGRMEKPEVDYIKGVSPAIAIEQKVNTRNPRSTVGTTTEIYDYFKLLYARIGVTYSPVSGAEVKRDTVESIVEELMALDEGTRLMILAPFYPQEGRSYEDELKILLQKGYTRVRVEGEVVEIEGLLESKLPKKVPSQLEVLIDRLAIMHDEETQFRLGDSVQTACFEGQGYCSITIPEGPTKSYSEKFEADGISFEEPTVNLFTFNNPYGACRTCDGFGRVLGIDRDLVVPDKSLSIHEGAIAPWRGETLGGEWLSPLVRNGIKFNFPIHRPWQDLTQEEQDLVWKGNKYFKGLDSFFQFLEENTYKIQYRVMLSRFRGRTTCPDCKGTRLRKDASYVKINGKSLQDLVLVPVADLHQHIKQLTLNQQQQQVSKQLLREIENRLSYLNDVGLGYLTLNRLTSTLSGGEFQRIKLATSLGSALVGSMYILDEPSIGLHPRDSTRLVKVLKHLRDLGNTVIVVEHEEEIMKAADQIIDIGPDAGRLGGQLVFHLGVTQNAKEALAIRDLPDSHTMRFLTGKDQVPVPKMRRPWVEAIQISGARENNLKNVSVQIPLGILTVVTGVSGSGKSTLIKKVLHPSLAKFLGLPADETGKVDQVSGSVRSVKHIEFVDQNPIGKSSRSNPITYIKAYDAIRALYAEQAISKTRGYHSGFFSFNVDGGRCEVCQGEGEVKIEMQFMADIFLKCESCHGKRFKSDVLEVKYKDKDIAEVLDMTVAEALEFFQEKPRIAERVQPLFDVGLGYIKLGQSSNTLSGGEAQRVKLASYLGKSPDRKSNAMFIFDEPTTGLHFHDIAKLLKAIQALIEQQNTVIIIEHNMEVIKSADWIIDMGPEGGEGGGQVSFTGTPEAMIALKDTNYTARYLAEKLG